MSSTPQTSGPARSDQETDQMSPALKRFLAEKEELEKIDVRQVAHALGGIPNQDNDPTKWKLPNGSNFWFKKNTQGWKDLNGDRGGVGPVMLVRHVLEFPKDRQAMNWLKEHFAEDGKLKPGIKVEPMVLERTKEEKQFRPPGNFERYVDEVVQYLTAERGLPVSLVQAEIQAGRLYATRKEVDENNQLLSREDRDAGVEGHWLTHCVFIGKMSGELRSTAKNGFKGTVPGSDPDISGYMVPHIKSVAERISAQVEAAVDAQSYRALFPGRIVMSTNGAARFQLQFKSAIEALSHPGFGVRLAQDADDAGDLAAQRVFNAFYASKALSRHLGMDVEDLEEAFCNGVLTTEVDTSPHMLFFGNDSGYARQFPVHEKKVHQWEDARGKHITTTWEATGEMAQPTVVVRCHQPIGGLEPGAIRRFHVSPRLYSYVVNDLDVRRERPKHAKDWNEILKNLGATYLRDYEQCAANGFKALPTLPPHLEALRDRSPQEITVPPLPPVAAPEPSSAAPVQKAPEGKTCEKPASENPMNRRFGGAQGIAPNKKTGEEVRRRPRRFRAH